MLCIAQKKFGLGSLFFILGTTVRANGILNSGFLLWHAWHRLIQRVMSFYNLLTEIYLFLGTVLFGMSGCFAFFHFSTLCAINNMRKNI